MTIPEPPVAGDEVQAVTGELERQRALFAWKCGGVDAEGMSKTLGPSTMTATPTCSARTSTARSARSRPGDTPC